MIRSAEEFVALRTSDDLAEQRRAAIEPAEEQVWLDVVARHPEMRVWVARNKTVPAALLSQLARDTDPIVRREVAGKHKTPLDLLRVLAADEDELVRRAVARHKRADRQVLGQLADDPSAAVREVARDNLQRARESDGN